MPCFIPAVLSSEQGWAGITFGNKNGSTHSRILGTETGMKIAFKQLNVLLCSKIKGSPTLFSQIYQQLVCIVNIYKCDETQHRFVQIFMKKASCKSRSYISSKLPTQYGKTSATNIMGVFCDFDGTKNSISGPKTKIWDHFNKVI